MKNGAGIAIGEGEMEGAPISGFSNPLNASRSAGVGQVAWRRQQRCSNKRCCGGRRLGGATRTTHRTQSSSVSVVQLTATLQGRGAGEAALFSSPHWLRCNQTLASAATAGRQGALMAHAMPSSRKKERKKEYALGVG